jgi:hypothetical protein
VFFLGAGASIDKAQAFDLPSGAELSKTMADECGLEWHKTIPLSTIAFYYEFLRGRDRLTRMLEKKIGDPAIQPSTTIRRLIDIAEILEKLEQRTVFITTNYDRHFERAYEAKLGRAPEVLIYQGARDPNERNVRLNRDLNGELRASPTVWLPRRPTTLYKMHGCISQPHEQGLVITEEDYINFLTNALGQQDDFKRIPTAIMGRIAEGTIIFIGYSLDDWNFRCVYKATVEAHSRPGKSFAVQYWDLTNENDTQFTKRNALAEFWGRKYVDILNVEADEFMNDLALALQGVAVGAGH